MSQYLLTALLLASALCTAAQQLSVTAERPRADYAAGETATFVVADGEAGEVTYQVRHNLRTAVIVEGTVQHDGNRSTIDYAFPEPTFINVTVAQNGRQASAGATFSSADIDALGDEPADWDEFWRKQKDELAGIPLNAVVEEIPGGDYSTSYRLTLDQIDGRQVHGYVVVPDGAGPFPASLRLPPFGSSGGIMQPDVRTAERYGAIAVGIAIHDAPADEEDPNAYEPNDIRDAEQIYYRYAVLAAVRAIDYIATRDDWDGENVLVYGDSQGGGLTMLTAGVDGRVTHLITSIAALAQHGGLRAGRPSGFPYYLEKARAVYGESATATLDSVFAATKYYDAVFAAQRFDGPSVHFVGYLDDVCPPATAYAAFNEMRGPRVMLHSLDLAHSSPDEFVNGRGAFFREHFPSTRTPPWPWPGEDRSHYVDAGEDRTVVTDSVISLAPSYGFDGEAGSADWPVRWRVVSGPNGAGFSDSSTATPTVSFRDSGTYVLQLRVTDPYEVDDRKFWTLVDEVIVRVSARQVSGLRQNRPQMRLTLAPNPVAETLEIGITEHRGQNLRYEIFAPDGRRVRSAEVRGAEILADVVDLMSGTYMVRLVSETEVVATGTFVKQ